jgi:uncharacterized RDD family membrane protein YckC
MRCPKCGYNSFDHLDSCKKCGADLVEFKQSFGIRSVLFPGQMKTSEGAGEVELDSVVADAAVEAATGTVEPAVAATVAEPAAAEGDSDDFGFDFMGDSAEDDDLSFDELFEEAPEDEDIEETIEGPKGAAAADGDSTVEASAEDDDLEDDFGFDPVADEDDSEVADDFTFDDNESDSDEDADDSGTEEGPKRPFDLPESSQFVGAPVNSLNVQDEIPSVSATEDVAVEAEGAFVSVSPEAEEIAEPVNTLDEKPVTVNSSPQTVAVETPEVTEPVDSDTAAVIAAPLAPSKEKIIEKAPVTATEVEGVVAPSLAGSIGAFLCDFAIIAAVAVSFIVAAEAAMSSQESRYFPSVETLVDLSIPYFLVIFFLAFGYFTLFHFLAGQTPGKMMVGLRVETIEGEPLAFSQAFLRSVGGLLQLLPAGLGYLLVLMSPDRRGWNDRLAGTRVISLS